MLNKLYYVRCIFNFMFGCIGDKSQVNQICNVVVNFISNKIKFVLYFNETIVISSYRHVKYLGALIC
jgi:hypothetical protein